MSDDLFQPDPADVPLIDPNKDYSPELIGEGKRYRDNAAAARALLEKDHFIEQLKREQAESRRVLANKHKEEEFLAKLESLSTRPPEHVEQPTRDGEVQPTLKLEDIERAFDEREAKRTANANLELVQNRLRETFGPEFKARVAQTAKELGIGTDFLTQTAAKSPDAFFKLIGVTEQPRGNSFEAPPRSSSLPNSDLSGKKKMSDYEKLRKEKGDSWYFSVPVQQEIWREAKLQGEAFLDK